MAYVRRPDLTDTAFGTVLWLIARAVVALLKLAGTVIAVLVVYVVVPALQAAVPAAARATAWLVQRCSSALAAYSARRSMRQNRVV
jgi:hypothetical protein